MMETSQRYFLEKGQRELPFVEQTWILLGGKNKRNAFLDGYTRDFFGATVARWDELYRFYTRMLWAGW